MRWESLFEDMEAQLAATEAADVRVQVAELVRAERASVGFADRARESLGAHLRVTVTAGVVSGVLVDVAAEWLLLDVGTGRQALVPAAAVVAVVGLAVHAAPPGGAVHRRLTLGHALRALARDRVQVRVGAGDEVLVGRIDRVGSDHLDLTPTDGRSRSLCVPFGALSTVWS